jgi:hypothetical protein
VSGNRIAKKIIIALASVATIFAFTSATASATPISHRNLPSSYAEFAAHATSTQNAAILQIMTRNPGGVRVSVYKVKWPNGISFTIDGPKLQPQLTGYQFDECSGDGGAGACLDVPQPDMDKWYSYGASIKVVESWYNYTTARVWLEQFQDSGNELCIDPYENGNYDTYNYNGVDDHDYWTLLTTNTAVC